MTARRKRVLLVGMNKWLDEVCVLGDEDLLSKLDGFAACDRRLNAQIVAHLAEVYMRKLHLDQGYTSLYVYANERLGFSEDQAYKRARTAKLVHDFPEVLDHLESGELTLSSAVVLAPHLAACCDEVKAEAGEALIEQARGMSKRQAERLVAQPPRGGDVADGEPRVKLELWVRKEDLEKFERAVDLDRHKDPSGDSAALFARLVDQYVKRREKERFAVTDRPRTAPGRETKSTAATAPGRSSEDIPAATKRQVYLRDEKRCTFVGPSGTRCTSTGFLEIDHVVPRALGGGSEASNLRLLCRSHNGRAAEHALGVETVTQAKGKAALRADATSALVNLGFSRKVARRAVGHSEGATIEAVIRSALKHTPRAASR
jgi:5-methylcytosine-specific restriction endonuclease McrA